MLLAKKTIKVHLTGQASTAGARRSYNQIRSTVREIRVFTLFFKNGNVEVLCEAVGF